ncbi:MAG: single-stranded-DNA-specific exonuclease RecJ [Gemmatimonadaceae bacterium]
MPPSAPDAAAVAALAADLSLPPAVCTLLLRRGHGERDAARRFLRPRLEQLHEPDTMLDLDVAVQRLERAIRDGETILVHGDYDVDGMCSTTLMTRVLRGLGGIVVPFIPRRLQDGYDLTDAGVRAAVEAGAGVVLTCDCGTSAREPVAALVARGIDVIISDHHLPGGPLPECLAVLNPRRPGCPYPDKDLAAVGVAFKLALALTRRMGGNENAVYRLLDLVALATVADIAPLRGENRVLVRYGLKLLGETANVGLRALIRSSGLEGKPLTAGRVGFILAPRLNAVGRLGHALRGVELLMCEDEHAANGIARELEEFNRRRQELDRQTLAEARAMVARLPLDETFGIVLASDRWHAGVIGIVASRIVEETGRPTVLVAIQDGVGKGSGRSIPAFDLHGGLGECRDLLLRFGGHRAAAGVTIDPEQVQAFAERFNAVASERLTEDDLVRELRVDLELPIDEASGDLEMLLRHFEPFGIGNAAPLLVSRGVRLAGSARVVGQDGLKLRLRVGDGELEALGWGMGAMVAELGDGALVDVAYRLERDEFRGVQRLQARLADVVRH